MAVCRLTEIHNILKAVFPFNCIYDTDIYIGVDTTKKIEVQHVDMISQEYLGV